MIFKKLLVLSLIQFFAFGVFSQQKKIKYLSGADNNHTVAWDFFCTDGRNSGYWTKIQVPSQW